MKAFADIWQGDSNLTETIRKAFETSGLRTQTIPQGDRPVNPRRYLIEVDGCEEEVWVYAANISPKYKGIVSDKDFFVLPRLRRTQLNPAGATLSLVYDPTRDVYIAADPMRFEVRVSEKDPSLGYMHIFEFPKAVLEKVLSSPEGIAFHVEPTREEKSWVYVGMKPWFLGTYLRHVESLHTQKGLIENCRYQDGSSVIPPYAFGPNVVGLARLFEDATRENFRVRVADAYNRQCAATGLQLGLFDGAHIYPSKQPDTSHEITNGIALAPTIHRAMDQGLVYLAVNDNGSYEFRMNHNRVVSAAAGGSKGLKNIDRVCGKKLKVPKKKTERPAPLQILKANILHGIPGFAACVPDGDRMVRELAGDPAWAARIARFERS